MSNHDGPSKALDNLRGIIARDDNGLVPLDIIKLGHVAAWLEHIEMMLRHDQSKHIVKDTHKGEWPEEGQRHLIWLESDWFTHTYLADNQGGMLGKHGFRWLPAPPPPTDD